MSHIPLAFKLPRKHPLRLNGFIFLVFFFLGVTNILAQSPQPLPLQELIWEALRNNPQLKAYRDISKASRAQISPAGSQTMKRIAAPMVGGMVSSTALTLIVIPVLYFLWKKAELKRKKKSSIYEQ